MKQGKGQTGPLSKLGTQGTVGQAGPRVFINDISAENVIG